MKTFAQRYLALTVLLGMASVFIIGGAVLPLYGLFFHTALLAESAPWLLLPTRLLFPGQPLTPTLYGIIDGPPPSGPLSWWHTGGLLCFCALALLMYLAALRWLPERISRRYILLSTLLLGLLCVCIPVVTSQDLYSYIIYARMQMLYHLNPLTTSPQIIHSDPLYPHLYWQNQPSAYGPVWLLLTGTLQWLSDLFGATGIAPMVLALRLLGLASHLGSVLLIWSTSGHLPGTSTETRRRAVLAFAWNPLLLFEGCVNAHNDTVLLFFILLALWLLVRSWPQASCTATSVPWCSALLAILCFALATSIKVNVALLLPGLLLLLWTQPRRLTFALLLPLLYAGIIFALYAPFWQGGTLLDILRINPGTSRDINTLPEFLSQFLNSLLRLLGQRGIPEIGSPSESTLHTLSLLLFVLLYIFSLLRIVTRPGHNLNTPARLIRWMAFSWLLYCVAGTPWFWPWYAVTFMGLFALVEASNDAGPRLLLAARLLPFSLLSLYCFFTWAAFITYVPWLPGFRWSFWRGLWAWLIPLLSTKSRYAPHPADPVHETVLQ